MKPISVPYPFHWSDVTSHTLFGLTHEMVDGV
jgi:hypothetical protein